MRNQLFQWCGYILQRNIPYSSDAHSQSQRSGPNAYSDSFPPNSIHKNAQRVFAAPVPGAAGPHALSGEGTEQQPYIIKDLHSLNLAFSKMLERENPNDMLYFRQVKSIDLGRNPLAAWQAAPERCIDIQLIDYDGNGCAISNAVMQNRKNAGFFGAIAWSRVSNLKIENCYFEGTEYAGGLAGLACFYTEFVKCQVLNSTVKAYDGGGGMAGFCFDECQLKDCRVDKNSINAYYSGRLCGIRFSSDIIYNGDSVSQSEAEKYGWAGRSIEAESWPETGSLADKLQFMFPDLEAKDIALTADIMKRSN